MTGPADTARAVVLNPARFCDRPRLLSAAWSTLMAARGNRVDMARTGPPRHMIDSPTAPDTLCARLRYRIRARAEQIGKTGPEPLILPMVPRT